MLVAGDVLGDVGAGTFGVAHLAEDTSARAGDAFDSFEGSTIMGSDPIMLTAPFWIISHQFPISSAVPGSLSDPQEKKS